MKSILKVLIIFLSITVLLVSNVVNVYSDSQNESLTILFTHDLHDHIHPFSVNDGENISTVGGFARLSDKVKKEKEIDPEALLVDAGDFSMGTLFQTIFSSQSPGIRLMGQMGYDVVTFGNHEFDFKAEGLANNLDAAKNSGDPLPEIVASNIEFPYDDNKSLTPSLDKLKKSMDDYGVKDYTIINRNGKKIGIFGLMGPDADSNAPMSEVIFPNYIEEAKRVVEILKDKENVDLIVCLSHSGTSSKKSNSEDEILADKVSDIDVIISGHSHTELGQPIIFNNTIIASSGSYGEKLGVLNISQDSNKNWKLKDYRLEPIDDSLSIDPDVNQSIENFKNIVQKQYLNNFNLKFDEILAYSSFDFTPSTMLGVNHSEDVLGNLITDSYIYAIKEAEGSNYQPITASIAPVGVIRDSFSKGNITVSDVFNVSSLGIGPDNISGYPLISVYLTGKELKTAAEVDASITPLMGEAQLYMSGLNYSFNPNRLIFNKVTDAYIKDINGSKEEIKDDKLYRVAAGLYSAQMLSVVGDQSMGILSIIPKDKDGHPITDFEKQIIYDDNKELKEWLAVAKYLKSFDEKNNIPQVPIYYEGKQVRKIVNDNKNIFNRLKNPNKIWLIVYSIIIVIIGIISSLIVFIIKHKKHKKIKNK